MTAAAHFTDCGLPGVRQIPYGVHMCSFYDGREELAATLAPYFAAGLRNRERCIWVTAPPLSADAAPAALRCVGVDVDAALASGALVVRDFSDWYAANGSLRGKDVANLWLAEEARALADGHEGLRITGNVTFLAPRDWPHFMEYEALIEQAFHGRRIVTLCTYSRHQCSGAEILDVASRHSCTLDRPDEGWQLLTAGG
jgi:hypothetical protein